MPGRAALAFAPPARRVWSGLLLAALLAAAPRAAAVAPAGPSPLRVECRVVAGRLQAAVDLTPAFGAVMEQRLDSGLSSRVRLTVAALDPRGAAVASAGRDYDVRFDLWTEIFTVTVREPGAAAVSWQAPGWAAVRGRLATPEPFDLGPVDALPEPFSIEAQLELDPTTPRQLERTREQLAFPAGGPIAGARSLLGTLAAFLLRAPPPEIERFRSTPRRRAAPNAP